VARQETDETGRALFGIFVEVGVPGSGEGNAKAVRNERPELSDVARSGDMQKIRGKAANGVFDDAVVAPEQKIEVVLLVQRKADAAAAAGDTLDRSVAFDLIACPPADDEEGESTAAGEGLKLPGGVGYAVNFVIRVREERDA
jgi:hypothetical protein